MTPPKVLAAMTPPKVLAAMTPPKPNQAALSRLGTTRPACCWRPFLCSFIELDYLEWRMIWFLPKKGVTITFVVSKLRRFFCCEFYALLLLDRFGHLHSS